jgi:hypothetical protein
MTPASTFASKPRWIRAAQLATLAGLLVYVAATVVYNSPNNYVKAFSTGFCTRLLEPWFAQEWGFFAPPPQFNFRLVLLAESAEWRSVPLELDLMREVVAEKQRQAPFHSAAEALDYMLFGCVWSVDNQVGANLRKLKAAHPDQPLEKLVGQARDGVQESEGQNASILALKRYAELALAKRSLANQCSSLKLRITKAFLPTFSAVMNKDPNPPRPEVFVYETKSWEPKHD